MFEKYGAIAQNLGFIVGGAIAFTVLRELYLGINPTGQGYTIYECLGLIYIPLTLMWFLKGLKDLKKTLSEYFLFSVGVGVALVVFTAEKYSLSFYEWLAAFFVLTFLGAVIAAKKFSFSTVLMFAGGGVLGLIAYGAVSGSFSFFVLLGIILAAIAIASFIMSNK
jgi:hypothetical protein